MEKKNNPGRPDIWGQRIIGPSRFHSRLTPVDKGISRKNSGARRTITYSIDGLYAAKNWRGGEENLNKRIESVRKRFNNMRAYNFPG